MFHTRKVSEEERHAEPRNSDARILLELSCVRWIVFGSENLHRDGYLIDITFGEKRRVANRDTVDQSRLVLAGSKAKCGPPTVTESNRADENVCEVNSRSAVRFRYILKRKRGAIIRCESIVQFLRSEYTSTDSPRHIHLEKICKYVLY